jgi:aryl-alcohol dehydrogenase-like predicted oxidoreductase
MQINKRPLGSSGLEITTIGFGSWAIGGGGWSFGWGPQDDKASQDTMRHAIEIGINWIDTAAVYGLGHSEEVVGRFLRSLPPSERPFIFTKCGLVWDERNRMQEPKRVLKPESIRAECEASLRRLGVERIDLYQFHWPDETGTPVEDSWAEMLRLIEEGKVRLAGVSNFDVGLLDRCAAIRHVDSLQPPFSLIHRDAAAHQIPWCEAHKTGVICYSPMQSGLLTDRFSSDANPFITETRLDSCIYQVVDFPSGLVADAMEQFAVSSNLLQTFETAFFVMNGGQAVADKLLGHIRLSVTVALRLLRGRKFGSLSRFFENIPRIVGDAPRELSADIAIKRATKRIMRVLVDAGEFKGFVVIKRRMAAAVRNRHRVFG